MLVLLLSALTFSSTTVWAKKKKGYRKATEGHVVVMNKLFPKKNHLEINSSFGGIINQSYIETMVVHGGINYHFSEVWGIALEGVFAFNTDKVERACLETFYNKKDESTRVNAPCGSQDNYSSVGSEVNIGPAYVPIIEINSMYSLSAIWTPIYGKQIFSFLPKTSHMDIFIALGGGMAATTFYPKKTTLNNGKGSRSDEPAGTKTAKKENILAKIGASPDEVGSYGELGRPKPQKKQNIFINFGVGQKYYFLKRMFLKVELRNYTLTHTGTGIKDGVRSVFAIWSGLGVKF